MPVVHTASATATGDARNGHVRCADGVIDTDLAVPKEMGGPGGALPNPEAFFAAGFHSALKDVARRATVDVPDSAVTVDVGPHDAGDFGLTVAVEAALPGVDEATARTLVDAAHRVCPYSDATRGNVDVTLTIA